MAYKDDLVRNLKRDIVDLRRELRPLEASQVQIAQRPLRGVWADTTQSQIRRLKAMIATLESVVAQFEDEKPSHAKGTKQRTS
jgi:hypothetical protein